MKRKPLEQFGNRLHVLALVEAGIEGWRVLEVTKAEQLQGAELAVCAQAYLKAEVSDGSRFWGSLLLDVSLHLVEWHVEQAFQTFTLCRVVFVDKYLDGALSWRIDGFL